MRRHPVDQPFNITNPFGVPDSAAAFGFHAGEDYGVGVGRNVYAEVSGTVTNYIWGEYHGNVVQIFDGKNYFRYMHNSELLVNQGDRVEVGQLIAKSGKTGKGVTGPHVHRDISSEKHPTSFNSFIDPEEYLKERNDMSKVGRIEIEYLYTAMQGYPPNENDIKAWEGMESNTFIRALHENGRYEQVQAEIKEARLKAALYDAGTKSGDRYEPVTVYRKVT